MNFEPLSDIRFGWRSKLNFAHFVCGGSEEEKNEGKGIKNMVNQDISLRKAKKKSSYWRNWFSAASIINLTYHRRVMGRNDLNLWFRLPHTSSIFGGCWPLPWADAEEKSNFPLARVFISAAGNNIFLLYFSSARYFSLQVSTRASTISSNIHPGLTRLTQNEIFNLSTLFSLRNFARRKNSN